jgi:beta-lactamase class A
MFSQRVGRRAVIVGSAAASYGLRPSNGLSADGSGAAAIAALEQQLGGHIGVAVLDTGSPKRIAHRADERFPMCSTFKFLLAAAVLARVDKGAEDLERTVPVQQEDLLDYAPIAKQQLERGGMTVAELCAAAVEYSDNAATNLLLRGIGGPPALTEFVRALGDPVTRHDRYEPEVNTAIPGDARDTTSPNAMLADLDTLLLGTALGGNSRQQLENWLVNCVTGFKRLRAGMPSGWRVGDKTGLGENGTSNDIAIVRPPNRAPILIATYITGSPASAAERDSAIAKIGRLVAAT